MPHLRLNMHRQLPPISNRNETPLGPPSFEQENQADQVALDDPFTTDFGGDTYMGHIGGDTQMEHFGDGTSTMVSGYSFPPNTFPSQ